MSIGDDILGHLANGPATTTELSDALNLSVMQVSQKCSVLKTEGKLTRSDETKQWALAQDSARAGTVEVLPAVRRRRVRHVPAKRTKPEPTLYEAIAEKLQQQVNWAQEALDDWLAAQGDPKTKVLVDNLIAAKAAQLAFEAEA